MMQTNQFTEGFLQTNQFTARQMNQVIAHTNRKLYDEKNNKNTKNKFDSKRIP